MFAPTISYFLFKGFNKLEYLIHAASGNLMAARSKEAINLVARFALIMKDGRNMWEGGIKILNELMKKMRRIEIGGKKIKSLRLNIAIRWRRARITSKAEGPFTGDGI